MNALPFPVIASGNRFHYSTYVAFFSFSGDLIKWRMVCNYLILFCPFSLAEFLDGGKHTVWLLLAVGSEVSRLYGGVLELGTPTIVLFLLVARTNSKPNKSTRRRNLPHFAEPLSQDVLASLDQQSVTTSLVAWIGGLGILKPRHRLTPNV